MSLVRGPIREHFAQARHVDCVRGCSAAFDPVQFFGHGYSTGSKIFLPIGYLACRTLLFEDSRRQSIGKSAQRKRARDAVPKKLIHWDGEAEVEKA